MKLLTKELMKKLPGLRETEKLGDEATVWVKFFDPCSNWTWFMTEYDPETETGFGFVVGHEEELGYFSVAELRGVRNRMGLPLERDRWWEPVTLAEVKAGNR